MNLALIKARVSDPTRADFVRCCTDLMPRAMVAVLALSTACGSEYQLANRPDISPADVLECGFTPIPGTQVSVYDCNPVFVGTDEAWSEGFRSVGFRAQYVLGHPFYQIWYSSTDRDGSYGIGYAGSSDGTTWETHPDNPVIADNRGWDASSMEQLRVVWDAHSAEYVMAYQGYNVETSSYGLGMMQSPDGVDWSPVNGGRPVVDFTQISDEGIRFCWPIGFSWTPTRGYFGYLGGSPSTLAPPGVCQIYDFSAPTIQSNLDLNPEPVLTAGPEPYDAAGMGSAATFVVGDTWYMFYVGSAGWDINKETGLSTTTQNTLNLATSPDGETWTKHPDNPLPVALTEEAQIRQVEAQVVGSTVLLWIVDYYQEVGDNAVGYYLFEP